MKPNARNKNQEGPKGTRVEVKNNNVNQALRSMKKIMTDEGVFREMRDRRFFEKPSVTRRRKKAAARKRWLKELAKNGDV